MRYIGAKNNLLVEIEKSIKRHGKNYKSFCDIFSGTASVANYFKKDYQVISNDLLYFSYTIQKAIVELNEKPKFDNLIKVTGINPFVLFATLDEAKFDFKSTPFIYENYSPTVDCTRQYITNRNALRIDSIRQTIENWKVDNLINDGEYFYLIAGLVEAVPFISNIAGTYGAYLKHWDSRCHKLLVPIQMEVTNNNQKNICFNLNSNELIQNINGDILYIDPPYNGRQYLANYHLLETIAKYDNPQIKGVTGIRLDKSASSDYCKKNKVNIEFEELIQKANFKLIVLSYSNEGIMKEDEIIAILEKYGNKKTLSVDKIPYRRYKRTVDNVAHNLNELIFTIEK